MTVKALYEGGVFRPVERVAIAEGTEVEITVHVDAEPRPANALTHEALMEIASLPPEGPQDGFSGADHDKILYGGSDAR
jgi:predicted DNA-binding antitoxin AbrB/MazE fold protein